nr:hypothetical protein Q903MT_gene718 [Picea sitchensis]QHR89020.1 hypothetical protein Q903MT_gene3039 [Picea sitchensis]
MKEICHSDFHDPSLNERDHSGMNYICNYAFIHYICNYAISEYLDYSSSTSLSFIDEVSLITTA